MQTSTLGAGHSRAKRDIQEGMRSDVSDAVEVGSHSDTAAVDVVMLYQFQATQDTCIRGEPQLHYVSGVLLWVLSVVVRNMVL